jgi:hypothetical protein
MYQARDCGCETSLVRRSALLITARRQTGSRAISAFINSTQMAAAVNPVDFDPFNKATRIATTNSVVRPPDIETRSLPNLLVATLATLP